MKIFFLFFLFSSCGSTKHPPVVENTIKAEDTIKIKVNENFEIKLGAVMGTGYRWILRYSSSSGLNMLSNIAWCPESGLLMGSGRTYSPSLGQVTSEVEEPVPNASAHCKFKEASRLSFKKGE